MVIVELHARSAVARLPPTYSGLIDVGVDEAMPPESDAEAAVQPVGHERDSCTDSSIALSGWETS